MGMINKFSTKVKSTWENVLFKKQEVNENKEVKEIIDEKPVVAVDIGEISKKKIKKKK